MPFGLANPVDSAHIELPKPLWPRVNISHRSFTEHVAIAQLSFRPRVRRERYFIIFISVMIVVVYDRLTRDDIQLGGCYVEENP